ncbi:hypothetical protein ABTY40_11535, partial [Streptomyces sp. NPDC126503]
MHHHSPPTRRALLTAASALNLGDRASVAPAAPGGRAARDRLPGTAVHRLTTERPAERGRALPARARAPDEHPALRAGLVHAGPGELSRTLATGATLRAHGDGCLAVAPDRHRGDRHRRPGPRSPQAISAPGGGGPPPGPPAPTTPPPCPPPTPPAPAPPHPGRGRW